MVKNTRNTRNEKQQFLDLEIILGVTNGAVKSKPTNCSLKDLDIECHEQRSGGEKMTTYHHLVSEGHSGFDDVSTGAKGRRIISRPLDGGGGAKYWGTAISVFGDGTASITTASTSFINPACEETAL